MLKTSKKALLIAVLSLCIVASGYVAYSYLFVSSNVVSVNMQYSVALSSSVTDSTVTLTATVTNGGSPVRAGIVVDFYASIDGAPSSYFATALTDANGLAQTTYAVLYNGGYDFQAIVTIP
jgi:hypothetical protein